MKSIILLASLAASVNGAPSVSSGHNDLSPRLLSERATICGPDELVRAGDYNILNSHASDAGSQCSTVGGQFSQWVRWSTTWSWNDNLPERKSFVGAESRRVGPVPISSFSSLATTWKWTYEHEGEIAANVAYEITGSRACTSTKDWSLQVWLATYGSVTPPGTLIWEVNIGNVPFSFYYGGPAEGSIKKRYTFVAKTAHNDYTGDILDFVDYVTTEIDGQTNWCINSAKGGTQTFSGRNALFYTEMFSLVQTISPPPATTPPLAPGDVNTQCQQRWGQCGGAGYTGPTCCQIGDFCAFWNDWESQCLPEYL